MQIWLYIRKTIFKYFFLLIFMIHANNIAINSNITAWKQT